jgi:hypothetical protein
MESNADRFRFAGWPEPPKSCDCFPLARRGPVGDFEIYCPKCGLVFRKSADSQSDAGAKHG